jgi:hypothetical protein
MFDSDQGGQISWLLPAALILLAGGLAVTWRRTRTDRQRAGLILWGGWLLVTGLVFSFMQGIFHAYYTVALAPAIGAVVGMGAVLLWRARRDVWPAALLAITVAVSAWWSYHLLARSADFLPWLRWTVLIVGLLAAVAVLGTIRLGGRAAAVAVGVALVTSLAGPSAYAVQTASQPHTGSIPTAGPAVTAGFGGGPGGRGGFPGGGFPGANGGGNRGAGGFGGFGGFGGQNGGTQNGQNGTGQNGTGQNQGGFTGGNFGGGRRGGGGGGMGGLLDASTVSAEMKALLQTDADKYTWAAAAVGSQSASGYQLATGRPVMAIGGFNGTDPSPTLAQFQQDVAAGKIHYFIGSGGGGFGNNMGGSNDSSQISQWVSQNFTAKSVGGATVYDLTAPTSTTTA